MPPNSVDPIEWARYNAWLSGAARVVFPAATRSRVPIQFVYGARDNMREIPATFRIPTLQVIIGIMKENELW